MFEDMQLEKDELRNLVLVISILINEKRARKSKKLNNWLKKQGLDSPHKLFHDVRSLLNNFSLRQLQKLSFLEAVIISLLESKCSSSEEGEDK